MANARRRAIWRRLPCGAFALGLVVVGILLLLPSQVLPETDIWDKAEHAGIFFGLTAIGLLAFPERERVWWLALGLISFGSTCEILQIFVPGRNAALGDALANALGVLSAVGLCSLLRPAIARRRQQLIVKRSGPAGRAGPPKDRRNSRLISGSMVGGHVTPSDGERCG
jgi:VanZ family protein